MISEPIRISAPRLKALIREAMNEELGSMGEQYRIAKDIMNNALAMHKGNINKKVIETEYSKDIKSVQIEIEEGMSVSYFSRFNPDTNRIFITIGELNLKNPEETTSAIAHELMHGNICLNRIHNNPSMRWDDTPTYYDDIINLIKSKQSGLLYYFAYAVYSTFYQETNAMVSQTSVEIIESYLKNGRHITEREFKKLYAQTNSVTIFRNNIETANELYEADDYFLNKTICSRIGIEEFNTTEKVRKACKNILNISKRALKDCARNSMLAHKHIFGQ